MNAFSPRTFSTDWEIMVIDRLERCVDTERLLAFAGALRSEFDLPIQVDWNTLELALGINSQFDQFVQRVQSVTDRAAQLVRELGLELYPAGSHPVEPMYNSSHIHIGTLHDEGKGIYLESRLMRYAPVFGAIAANSPFAHGFAGQYKSYRIRDNAHGCTRPQSARDPRLSQFTWGGDASPKVYSAPTLEVRITDCASSRRLLAELVVFTAAFVHWLGENTSEYRLSETEYIDCMTNRWSAAKHGMQATFLWDGTERPVVEIIDEMLDQSAASLAALGADRKDLALLQAMIEKRRCQADLVLDLGKRYRDPYCLASVHSKLVRDWEAFDNYVMSSAPLDPAPAPDRDRILNEHLSVVGEGTHFYNLRNAMYYPPTLVDELIETLAGDQLVHVENTCRGMLLSRVEKS